MAKNTDAEAPPKAKLFVITPIGGPGTPQRRHADMVFNAAIKPACETVGISPPDRADLIDTTSMISTNIFRNVEEADLAIADLTFLNPNVMYELGIRHAVEKPVIHIAQEGTTLPFDTSGHMTLFFDAGDWHSLASLSDQMATAIKKMLGKDYEVSNPLTQARGRRAIARSTDSRDQLISDLMSRVESLERSRSTNNPLMVRPIPQEIVEREFADANLFVETVRTYMDKEGSNEENIPFIAANVFDLFRRLRTSASLKLISDKILELPNGQKLLSILIGMNNQRAADSLKRRDPLDT